MLHFFNLRSKIAKEANLRGKNRYNPTKKEERCHIQPNSSLSGTCGGEGKELSRLLCLFSICWTRQVGTMHRIFHRMIWVILIYKDTFIINF